MASEVKPGRAALAEPLLFAQHFKDLPGQSETGQALHFAWSVRTALRRYWLGPGCAGSVPLVRVSRPMPNCPISWPFAMPVHAIGNCSPAACGDMPQAGDFKKPTIRYQSTRTRDSAITLASANPAIVQISAGMAA
jgi:hypothetical protein